MAVVSLPLRDRPFLAGPVFLGLGALGLFLPVLPTTPFVLFAAACHARGSPRFHIWLLADRTFGPLIEEWQGYRSIPYGTKLIAIAMMSVTLSASIVFFVRPIGLTLLLAACGLVLAMQCSVAARARPTGYASAAKFNSALSRRAFRVASPLRQQ